MTDRSSCPIGRPATGAPPRHLSVADAKAGFSALLDGVVHGGERYVIERHGRPVAGLVSVADLDRLEPSRHGGAGGAMALVGLWHDLPEAEQAALLERLMDGRAVTRDGTERGPT